MKPLPAYDSDHLYLYEDEKPLGRVAEFAPGDGKVGDGTYVLHKLVLGRIVRLETPARRLELFEEIPEQDKRLICAMKAENHTVVASNLLGPAPRTTILARQVE